MCCYSSMWYTEKDEVMNDIFVMVQLLPLELLLAKKVCLQHINYNPTMCYWSCSSPFPSFANIYAHSWRWLIYFSTCVISWYLSVLPLSLWDNQHSLWCYGIVIVNSCMVLHPCDCVASTGASVLSLLESSCTLCLLTWNLCDRACSWWISHVNCWMCWYGTAVPVI